MEKVITSFKNTTNISRTSFDRDKSFQMNVVYRIQIEKRVKYTTMLRKKYEKKFFCVLSGEIFFWHPVRWKQTVFFLGLKIDLRNMSVSFAKH